MVARLVKMGLLVVVLMMGAGVVAQDSPKVYAETPAAPFDASAFIGTWYSSRAQTNIQIHRDGTWQMTRWHGKWMIEGEYFVWIYENDSTAMDLINGETDKNRIISSEKDVFVLEELDGSTTTFQRVIN